MSREETLAIRRAYARGYNAGRRGVWPDHRPIAPPEPVICQLVEAALKLRNAVDGQLAMLGEDDEWQTTLGDPMDELDEAMKKLSAWILEPTP